MICNDCNGKGVVNAFVNTGLDSSQHYYGQTHCYRCNGTGSVPEEMTQWIEDGKRLRQERVQRGETLLMAANRQGLSIAQLSAIETGHRPQTTTQQRG
ncbi:hypothetical protein [Shewanella algae]|uniref:helix-turn-helix domain-containing protein n=1 Tax=Shewanella algae TaxID=38313 RepID=UPI0031F4DF2B